VEALKDEYFYFAWLLGREAFPGLDCDPDVALSEEAGGCGFREKGRREIPRVNLLDLRAQA